MKHQVKSSRYYLFWGIATIAVVAGQLQIASGYSQMSGSLNQLTETISNQWTEKLK